MFGDLAHAVCEFTANTIKSIDKNKSRLGGIFGPLQRLRHD